MNIVVTGGAGKAGRWVVRGLRADGHVVVAVDLRPPETEYPALRADLTDLGQVHELLLGCDAVVHLAAIPAWGIWPETETFRNNMMSTYNVFAAAVDHQIGRLVYASSETVLGVPFGRTPPPYVPVDEEQVPAPGSSYALAKLLSERAAVYFAARSATTFIGLRLSNIIEPTEYGNFRDFQADPRLRSWNLWGYVDARDVVHAVRAALTAPVEGPEVCIIAAADTVMPQQSSELLAATYPEVPVHRAPTDRETLLSIDRARRLLGYEPQHSWISEVSAQESS